MVTVAAQDRAQPPATQQIRKAREPTFTVFFCAGSRSLIRAKMEDDFGSTPRQIDGLHGEIAATFTGPAHPFAGGQARPTRSHSNAVRDNKGRIETHPKLTDQAGISPPTAVQLGQKLLGPGAGNRPQMCDRFVA